MVDYSQLKKLAELAAPGEKWVVFSAGGEADGGVGDFEIGGVSDDSYAHVYAIGHQSMLNANFIAAANADTVLAMIAEIELLRAKVAQQETHLGLWSAIEPQPPKEDPEYTVLREPFKEGFIRQPALLRRLDISRSGLDKLRKKDQSFPKPVKDGESQQAAAYYVLSEVDAWLKSKMDARTDQ